MLRYGPLCSSCRMEDWRERTRSGSAMLHRNASDRIDGDGLVL